MKENTVLFLLVAGVAGAVGWLLFKKQLQPSGTVEGHPDAIPGEDIDKTVTPTQNLGTPWGFQFPTFSSLGAGSFPPPQGIAGQPKTAPATSNSPVTWMNQVVSGANAVRDIVQTFDNIDFSELFG